MGATFGPSRGVSLARPLSIGAAFDPSRGVSLTRPPYFETPC
jgi:hypothetical protein